MKGSKTIARKAAVVLGLACWAPWSQRKVRLSGLAPLLTPRVLFWFLVKDDRELEDT